MKPMKRGTGWYLTRTGVLLFLVLLLVLTIHVTTRKDTTNTETALWTFILFAIGLAASFYFGRQSVSAAAADVVRPQAKAAGRRLVTLGKGVGALRQALKLHQGAAEVAAEREHGKVPLEMVDLASRSLEIQLDLQMRTVVDALEDWRQFDPEIANELLEDDD